MELVNETALIESTAGTLRVTSGGVAVFPSRHSATSLAFWYAHASDAYELRLLIRGVLYAGCPIQPLMDWVIEYGEPLLAHHVERVQAAILNSAPI